MNKKTTTTAVTLFAIAFATASLAYAITDVELLWKKLDADKDGVISMKEAEGSDIVKSQWSSMDVNQDDELTFREFSLVRLHQK